MGDQHLVASGSNPARIVLTDDHDLVRAGLKAMLSNVEGIQIVGEASNGREAVEVCGNLRPDLMLMDVRMPEMDGLAATREIKQRWPRVGVLILTVHENQDYLLEALKAGAAGYVLKDAPRTQLVASVRSVLNGESALDQKLSTQLLRRLASDLPAPVKSGARPKTSDSSETLTPRETEVLQLLAHGLSNQEVSRKLVVSVGTAKNHVQHIISKLGVSDRTQAVVRGLELGIITLPET
ncbi:MAG: response regulator transcription factor [Rubrobacter sp.]|nr:response regulator transcription factor [Rubrobacter sp.]